MLLTWKCCAVYITLYSACILANECQPNVTNRLTAISNQWDLPVVITSLNIDAYDIDKVPSCSGGQPNVVLPGYLVLSNGALHVSKDYDLINSGLVKATVKSNNGDEYCRDGKSVRWYIPDHYCTINLCSFIGNDICEVLQRQGIHTIEELVEKTDFDPWIKLPDPPCLIGLICLTDLFEDKYHLEFALQTNETTILQWIIPANRQFLQFAADSDPD